MNIEKKYYYPAALNELQAVKTKQSQLNGAASASLWENMTPFMQGVHEQTNGQNPYNGMSVFEARGEAARLEAAKSALLPKVANAFKSDWTTVKQEFQELNRTKNGAADRASKQWDYARLEYERKNARDFLSGADIGKIARKYNEIEISGDTHALRGFVEEGINSLNDTGRFSHEDVVKVIDLRQELEKMGDQLTISKEQRDLARQGEILTGKIADLYEATRQVSSEYGKSFEPPKDGNGDYMVGQGQPNPFAEMTKGVQVSRKIDPTNLGQETSVELHGAGWQGDAPEEKWKVVEKNGQYFKTPA